MSILSRLVEVNKQLQKKAISLNCKEKKSQRVSGDQKGGIPGPVPTDELNRRKTSLPWQGVSQ